MMGRRMGFLALGMMALGALSACQMAPIEAPARQTELVEVKVGVSEPCIAQAPGAVVYRWGVGPLPQTDKEKVAILLADYEQARQRDIDWQAAAAGCVVKQ